MKRIFPALIVVFCFVGLATEQANAQSESSTISSVIMTGAGTINSGVFSMEPADSIHILLEFADTANVISARLQAINGVNDTADALASDTTTIITDNSGVTIRQVRIPWFVTAKALATKAGNALGGGVMPLQSRLSLLMGAATANYNKTNVVKKVKITIRRFK